MNPTLLVKIGRGRTLHAGYETSNSDNSRIVKGSLCHAEHRGKQIGVNGIRVVSINFDTSKVTCKACLKKLNVGQVGSERIMNDKPIMTIDDYGTKRWELNDKLHRKEPRHCYNSRRVPNSSVEKSDPEHVWQKIRGFRLLPDRHEWNDREIPEGLGKEFNKKVCITDLWEHVEAKNEK